MEAEVWLVDDELHVGHRRLALTAHRTLQNLYVGPLLRLLELQNTYSPFYSDKDFPLDPNERYPLNGIFDTHPTRSFVLLIDFKSYGPALWWELQSQLSPLRDKGYLTHFNGTDIVERPITVVGTGNAPFEWLTANETYRDVFFDAPLEELADFSSEWPNPNRAEDPTRGQHNNIPGQDGTSAESQSTRGVRAYMRRGDGGKDRRFGTSRDLSRDFSDDTYNHFNSYYASVSFTKSIRHIWGSRLTQ